MPPDPPDTPRTGRAPGDPGCSSRAGCCPDTSTIGHSNMSAGAEEAMREAHIPTQPTQASQEARLSSPDVHSGWPGGAPCPPPQGSRSAVGLSSGLTPGVRGRTAFRSLRAEGRSARADGLRVVMVPRLVHEPSTPAVRVSVATRRDLGGAVVRNRLRRRVKHLFADMVRRGAVPPGDYLVVASARSMTSSSSELSVALLRALERLRGMT
jgi:ribonuclease P protein component